MALRYKFNGPELITASVLKVIWLSCRRKNEKNTTELRETEL